MSRVFSAEGSLIIDEMVRFFLILNVNLCNFAFSKRINQIRLWPDPDFSR